jgi:NadR type nicotinamide-nucleotide adenylyltransferase
MLKKIVVIGPESTGKSTLCDLLATHFNTKWVPEFAREFLLTNGKAYTYNDLLTIAKGQLNLEDKITSELTGNKNINSLLAVFIDTDMYVMKVWCEYVFNNCHQWIIDQITSRSYDLYLLCNTDLPWTKDELREYPDLETREKLFQMYKDIMINQNTPWFEIKGENEERIQSAIEAVNHLFK